ncbi:unnamed protein product [Prorocentrum cordatum]|uniref:Uncharacterized protein n=1 Tax=Prorocentrum cordatum TaxID=2364126 RepID=A0ABN9VKI7_9DINO|nr:unnamed protein product [Polarella glacialis]
MATKGAKSAGAPTGTPSRGLVLVGLHRYVQHSSAGVRVHVFVAQGRYTHSPGSLAEDSIGATEYTSGAPLHHSPLSSPPRGAPLRQAEPAALRQKPARAPAPLQLAPRRAPTRAVFHPRPRRSGSN